MEQAQARNSYRLCNSQWLDHFVILNEGYDFFADVYDDLRNIYILQFSYSTISMFLNL